MNRATLRATVTVLLLVLTGCLLDGDAPYVDHPEPSDFEPFEAGKSGGVSDRFDRTRVMEDDFFTDAYAVDGDAVQRFLESTPYAGRRCWLADYAVDGERAADAIVAGARREGINPIVMIARMQVEKSLISRTSRPSGNALDYAFGCGCADYSACNPAYRGIENQIACAARTLRRHYDGSVAGTGQWRVGRSRNTLDGQSITPQNHATASLYAYTPWVLPNSGGNWLVWNVTKKFERRFDELGYGGDYDGSSPPSCSVDGVAGTCIHVDECDEATHEPTPGHCPGPTSIQCCTPHSSPVIDGGGERECGVDAAEPNDSADEARRLDDFATATLSACEGDSDYFVVSLDAGASVTIRASFPSAVGLDLDLSLEDPDGELTRAISTDPDQEVLSLGSAPSSGQYLLRAYSYSGSGDYALELFQVR